MRVLIWSIALCAVLLSPGRAADVVLEQGEIEGAKFSWARPARWNRGILLLAHGLRPQAAPLVADLSPAHASYRALLNEGWIVAKTSYRRNGIIVADAISDLENLRAEIVRRFGKPTRVLVEGDSMGGLIAVLIAERLPESIPLFHGVIAVDPALGIREPNSEISGLSMQPQIPLVFLSSRTELEGPRRYSEMQLPGAAPFPRPVLLKVNRDGHVNVNQAERLMALRTLNAWLDHGVESLPKPAAGTVQIDATSIPEAVPSRVFPDADQRGFTAHITEISRVFGNILLDAQPADFASIGIGQGAYFRLSVRDQTFRVFFGKDFNSVKRGDWVTFLSADGFFWLGRNAFNAATTSQAEVGDLVQIRRYDGNNQEASGAEGR